MSVTKVTKDIFKCQCDHADCSHKWDADKIPARCASCKRRTWNRPPRVSTKAPLTFNGETLTVAEWSRKLGLAKTTIPWRLKQGWPMEQVLSKEDWRFQSQS